MISKHVISSARSLEDYTEKVAADLVQSHGYKYGEKEFIRRMTEFKESYHQNSKFFDYIEKSEKVFDLIRLRNPSYIELKDLERLPGWWDLAVILIPESSLDSFGPPYATLSKDPLSSKEEVIVYARRDPFLEANKKDFYMRFQMLSTSQDGADVILTGQGLGYEPIAECIGLPNYEPSKDSTTWKGVSGSSYLRQNRQKTGYDLVGLHSRGSFPISEGPTATGVNLTNPEIQKWILEVAGKNKVCGLTLECPPIHFEP